MAVRPLEVLVLLLLGLGATAVHGSETFSCPQGWTEGIKSNSSASCLKYFALHKNWSEAEASCNTGRASLVEIGSAQENEKVKSLMSHGAATWLGLTRNITSEKFAWQRQPQRPLVYTDWLPEQPDNWPHDSGQQNCGYMYNNGGWDDSACNHVHGYVCELLDGDCSTPTLEENFRVPFNTLPQYTSSGQRVRSGGWSGVFLFTCNNGVWQQNQRVPGCAGGAAGPVALQIPVPHSTKLLVDQNTLYGQGQIFVAHRGALGNTTWTCGANGRWDSTHVSEKK